ncbi:hypothetical protein SAMN04487843_10686 [Methylobacterium sp. ap11]|uniref:hypothetical protein n=1 Tax=Methylobacterium sp. ap11 TaxID=1761799 RepID=UPI0008C72F75|nr:hypothetical protein [Methylobacterium sp. ap11]SEP04731.1 hypothetical protein SAMN04487843_10686 [Methylobacterium sp. ap11]
MQEAGGLADRRIAPAGHAHVLIPVDARLPDTVDRDACRVGATVAMVRLGSTGVVADVVRLSGAVGRA